MNSNEPSEASPQQIPHTVPEPVRDPYQWLKAILAKNPLYIASAILLLYGIYRLSVDPKLFDEIGQLLFNFGAFQFYEIVLAATAIVLARRKIFYDFSLLISIECLFAFVPFLLISHAEMFDLKIATWFCLAGIILVFARFGFLKKHFEGMNFPPRLLLFGGVFLFVNVMLPLVICHYHDKTDSNTRGSAFDPLNEYLWLYVAPLLAGLAAFLPRMAKRGEALMQRGSFPLTAFGLWLAVTVGHLYCLNYVFYLTWTPGLVMPLIWAVCWIIYLRPEEIFLSLARTLRPALLALPLIVIFAAAHYKEWPIAFTLAALSCGGYGFLAFKQRNRVALQMLLISSAAMLAAIPAPILALLHLDLPRTDCIGLAVAGYLILQSLISRAPVMGIIGAIVAAMCVGVAFDDKPYALHAALQISLVYMLIHSLRWYDKAQPQAAMARLLVAGSWILHSLIWAYGRDVAALNMTYAMGHAVLLVYFAVRLIFGFWAPRVVPYGALSVLLSDPLQQFIRLILAAPVGMIALAGSFILFALGTAVALTRSRWHKPDAQTDFVAGKSQNNL